jgi:hypothetical protein
MKPLAELDRGAVRAVLLDIDETLTTEGKLTAQAYAALERLSRAGLRVVPVTGRPAGWCDHIARMWPVDAVVGENGAFYFHYGGGRLHKRFQDDATTRSEKRARLDAVAAQILAAVPGCALASDQPYRETDLAMLALFGCPHLDTVLAAYDEAAPLAAGWRDRVPLHQLFPLLVHVVLFGAGYAAQDGRGGHHGAVPSGVPGDRRRPDRGLPRRRRVHRVGEGPVRGRSRVILLLARLFACIFLGSAVFRFVRGLVDDPNLNEAQGFVGWSFAFLLLVVTPPALKVLFARGLRALRSMLSGTAKRAFLLAIAFGLAAGFLAGRLRGEPVDACLRLASAAGALAVQVPGDIEGLPYARDVDAVLAAAPDVDR